MNELRLRILGTRGIPASHGGFETLAQKLSEYLVQQGWSVTVYCHAPESGAIYEDDLDGIRLVKVPEPRTDALGTMRYDWKCIRHAAKEEGVVLTLGYNTALFNLWFRFKGIKNIINMDGMDWKRSKWGVIARTWLYFNDWAGCLIGNHLIADHPEIAKHLATRRSVNSITMIPYGADLVESANVDLIRNFELEPKQFLLCVARIEPENSILEIVRAFSSEVRSQKLVIVGAFNPKGNNYHAKIHEAASEHIVFLGAIYEKETVGSLRFHCSLYVHGHTVGGTNPTLVEAIGAGSPVLAQDNCFNRWVAGSHAAFFHDEKSCQRLLNQLLKDRDSLTQIGKDGNERFLEYFRWAMVLEQYEHLIASMNDQ
jgi:glycosyltransferase involved in cell wall biosynthesis